MFQVSANTIINSENNIKKVDANCCKHKTAYSHLDITTMYALIEDSGMLELFETDADKVEFQLKSLKIFESDDSILTNVQESAPMKGISLS